VVRKARAATIGAVVGAGLVFLFDYVLREVPLQRMEYVQDCGVGFAIGVIVGGSGAGGRFGRIGWCLLASTAICLSLWACVVPRWVGEIDQIFACLLILPVGAVGGFLLGAALELYNSGQSGGRGPGNGA
jgi:hypothetical protein